MSTCTPTHGCNLFGQSKASAAVSRCRPTCVSGSLPKLVPEARIMKNQWRIKHRLPTCRSTFTSSVLKLDLMFRCSFRSTATHRRSHYQVKSISLRRFSRVRLLDASAFHSPTHPVQDPLPRETLSCWLCSSLPKGLLYPSTCICFT